MQKLAKTLLKHEPLLLNWFESQGLSSGVVEGFNNKAKLTKFPGKCVIEFTGNLEAGKSVEQWAFKGLTLISGGSATFAKDGTSTANNFDLNAPEVQKNFLALRNHFHEDALAQCN